MKLAFVRFIFMICACFVLIGIINICLTDPTGYELLHAFFNLCANVAICAIYYPYMDFNHPSKGN